MPEAERSLVTAWRKKRKKEGKEIICIDENNSTIEIANIAWMIVCTEKGNGKSNLVDFIVGVFVFQTRFGWDLLGWHLLQQIMPSWIRLKKKKKLRRRPKETFKEQKIKDRVVAAWHLIVEVTITISYWWTCWAHSVEAEMRKIIWFFILLTLFLYWAILAEFALNFSDNFKIS